MRTVTGDELATTALTERCVALKVEVGSATSFSLYYDLCNLEGRDWVQSFSMSGSVDDPCTTAQITIAREEYELSLAPMLEASKLNISGGSYVPLLKLNNLVRVSSAQLPQDTERVHATDASLWREIFRGRIYEVDWSANPIRINLRDLAGDLQDAWLERPTCFARMRYGYGALVWQQGMIAQLGDYCVPSDPSNTSLWRCSTAGQCASTEPNWALSGPLTDEDAVWTKITETTTPWTSESQALYSEVRTKSTPDSARFICVSPGYTGTTEPTWPTVEGSVVVDGSCRWAVMPGAGQYAQPVELCMEALKLACGQGGPFMWTPVPSGYVKTPFQVGQESCLQRLSSIASEIGWDLRVAYNDAATDHAIWGKWQLKFYSPDRTKTTADFSCGPSSVYELSKVNHSLTTIRNAIEISYYSSADVDSSGRPVRMVYRSEDAASIAKYGRRWMAIGRASCLSIGTSDEATALANAILSDLAEPMVDVEVQMPFRWFLELGDLVEILATAVHFSETQKLALVSFSHTFEGGTAKSVFGCRGKPSAGHWKWHQKGVDPQAATFGRAVDTLGGDSLESFEDVTVTPTIKGLNVDVNKGKSFMSPRMDTTSDQVEIHVGTTSDFTPDDTTLKASGALKSYTVPFDASAGVQYVKAVRVAADGTRSPPTAPISASPALVTLPDLDNALKTAFRAYVETDYSTAAGSKSGSVISEILKCGHEMFDFDSSYDTSTFQFDLPVSGYFRWVIFAEVSGLSAGDKVRVQLRNDGTVAVESPPFFATSAGIAGACLVVSYPHSVDDLMEAWVQVTTSAATVTVEAANTSFEGHIMLGRDL